MQPCYRYIFSLEHETCIKASICHICNKYFKILGQESLFKSILLTATDADVGNNSIITFALPDWTSHFEINQDQGNGISVV